MNYNVGDLIRYGPFGDGNTRTGVVIEKEDDIKNGRPGFSMRCADGNMYWGYDYQILGVDRTDDPKELL